MPATFIGRETVFERDLSTLQFLSACAFSPGIKRILELKQGITADKVETFPDGVTRLTCIREMLLASFSVSPQLTREQLNRVLESYAEAFGSSVPALRVTPIACGCDTNGCSELGLKDLKTDFQFDYSLLKERIVHRYPDFFTNQDPENAKLRSVVNTMLIIDPSKEIPKNPRFARIFENLLGARLRPARI